MVNSASLIKGDKVNLTKNAAASGSTLKNILIGLGWDPKMAEANGHDFDLDASAFVLGADGRVLSPEHFIFFNHLASPEGAVTHTGDNLTGAGDGDDEVIMVDLAKVPAEAAKIVFSVSIYDGVDRRQNFGAVANSYIRAADADTNNEMAKYELDFDAASETVVVFGELVRRDADWYFSANSTGFPGGFDGLCRQYGLTV